MPEHCSRARKDAAEVRDRDDADEGGREALEHVQQDDGHAKRGPVRPPDVRCPDVAASRLPDVLAPEDADEPVAPRAGAGDVAEDDERDEEGH